MDRNLLRLLRRAEACPARHLTWTLFEGDGARRLAQRPGDLATILTLGWDCARHEAGVWILGSPTGDGRGRGARTHHAITLTPDHESGERKGLFAGVHVTIGRGPTPAAALERAAAADGRLIDWNGSWFDTLVATVRRECPAARGLRWPLPYGTLIAYEALASKTAGTED